MTKEECKKRINELVEISQSLMSANDWGSEEFKNNSDELDELLDYRKDQWPDDYDERNFALVEDKKDLRHGQIGLVVYVSHNEVHLKFPDGIEHYYHSMSLSKVKSSPELRAIWGEIPLSQYFKKKKLVREASDQLREKENE